MATESIISATFGVPGSGKTYSRVRFLVEDFLINNPAGMFITNIPLNIDVISDYISPLIHVSPEDVAARLHIIPDDELIMWEKMNLLENRDLASFADNFPPAVYLQQFNLEGAHIAIDEFHKYFSKKGPKLLKKMWNDWFAEIRKTGCVFEAVTQSYGQMSDEFLDKCASRLELVNHSELRDPFFGVRMGDWYELRAGLFNRPVIQRITERETMRAASNSGRVVWKLVRSRSYNLSAEFFKFYNSFRNYTGTSAERRSPSQIYGRKIIIWFLRRNFLSVFSRVLLASIVAWFLLGGGFQLMLLSFFRVFGRVGDSNSSLTSHAYSSTEKKVNVVKTSDSSFLPRKLPPGSSNLNPNFRSSGSDSQVTSAADSKVVFSDDSKDLKSSFLSYCPALFWDDFCVLRNGMQVNVGFVFKKGVFNGKKIISFDKSNRSICLDDGTVLYMHVVDFGL